MCRPGRLSGRTEARDEPFRGRLAECRQGSSVMSCAVRSGAATSSSGRKGLIGVGDDAGDTRLGPVAATIGLVRSA